MAYVPAHLFDPAAKHGDGVQGDAGVAAAFIVPLYAGRLHAGSNAREACSTGSGDVAGLFFRQGWHGTRCWISGSPQRGTKRAENCPFRALDGFNEIRLSALERMAGTTGLEPATSAVTGQRSNQLNYVPNWSERACLPEVWHATRALLCSGSCPCHLVAQVASECKFILTQGCGATVAAT